MSVGNPLPPTYASASILRLSNRTSIDGRSSPTLYAKEEEKIIRIFLIITIHLSTLWSEEEHKYESA
jgi:hypothetical protein